MRGNRLCLDENGEVIEGLYVLGNIMGDITAVDYPINVAGNSHGRCITFGYLLGHELAEAYAPARETAYSAAAAPPCGCGIPARKALFREPFFMLANWRGVLLL